METDILKNLLQKECIGEFDRAFAHLTIKEDDEGMKLLAAFLSYASRNGHLAVKFHESIQPSLQSLWKSKLSDDELSHLETQLITAFNEFSEVSEFSPFIKWNHSLYLRRNWEYESLIVKEWRRLKNNAQKLSFKLEELDSILCHSPLNSLQKKAVLKMFHQPVVCLTGGPGTGKTFTASFFIQHFLNISSSKDLRVILSAPTGKATQRLAESVQKNVSDERVISATLHSLFKHFNPFHAWKFNPSLLLEGDLFIIDEASMIDAALMTQLLQSIPSNSRLVLLGDPHQLPAVENGSLFADIIECEKKNVNSAVVALEDSVRIENPHIKLFSEALKESPHKAYEMISTIKTKNFETRFLNPTQEWLTFLNSWVKENLFVEDCDEINDEKLEVLFAFYQKRILLTPLRKGLFGVNELNQFVQKKYRELNKRKIFIEPILVTSSSVKDGLMNGDFGLLIHENFQVNSPSYAVFSQKDVYRKIPYSLLPTFERAYALSIHKSQGSEYNHVDLLIPEGAENFSKEIFYTAVTRAKKSLSLIAHPETFKVLLEKDTHRVSNLAERMTLRCE